MTDALHTTHSLCPAAKKLATRASVTLGANPTDIGLQAHTKTTLIKQIKAVHTWIFEHNNSGNRELPQR